MVRIIRIESQEQIAEVAALAREIWRQHYTSIVGRPQIEYMLQRFQSINSIKEQTADRHEYYFIDYSNQHAGYFCIVPNEEESSLMLSKIYVHRNHRDKGLGSAAVDFIEELCRERGIERIWLTVNRRNKDAIGWYGKSGFENKGPHIQDIGSGFVMDDFRMVKTVKSASTATILNALPKFN